LSAWLLGCWLVFWFEGGVSDSFRVSWLVCLGALLGGFLFSVLEIKVPSAFDGGVTLAWADMVVAFIGVVIILFLFGGFYRSRRSLA
jgi:hypothetical protein